MHDGRVAGISNRTGYTVNAGTWFSLGMIDEEQAVDGTEVTVVWGDPRELACVPPSRPTRCGKSGRS